MGRLKALSPDSLTPAQKKIAEARPDGPPRGPSSVWFRTPETLALVAPLMEHLRTRTSLEPRLLELMMLVPLRAWTAQFGWLSHEKLGLQAGLDKAVVDAIKHRRTPVFAREDEGALYALASEIVENKKVSDPTYARAIAAVGETTVVDAVTVVGFYMMVAGVLSTFQVDVHPGATPALAD